MSKGEPGELGEADPKFGPNKPPQLVAATTPPPPPEEERSSNEQRPTRIPPIQSRIFLSYSSPQRKLAERLAIALRSEGHEVFFDRHKLFPGDAFHAKIREEIRQADLMVFLISPQSIDTDSYARTELKVAELEWPSPAGRIIPVMAEATSLESVPAFLSEVQMIDAGRNIIAEVTYAVDRLSRFKIRLIDIDTDAEETRKRTEKAQNKTKLLFWFLAIAIASMLGIIVGVVISDTGEEGVFFATSEHSKQSSAKGASDGKASAASKSDSTKRRRSDIDNAPQPAADDGMLIDDDMLQVDENDHNEADAAGRAPQPSSSSIDNTPLLPARHTPKASKPKATVFINAFPGMQGAQVKIGSSVITIPSSNKSKKKLNPGRKKVSWRPNSRSRWQPVGSVNLRPSSEVTYFLSKARGLVQR
ncbi:MAG: toll/interleukin-1 receptor domain-containing protein [Myxococcota bacterium]